MPRNATLRRVALILFPWLLLLALWYALRYSGLVNPALVPAPHEVAERFVALMQDRLPMDILMSTQRVFIGVALGTLAAVPVGFCLGWYRGLRTFIDPVINFFRALPPIARQKVDSLAHRDAGHAEFLPQLVQRRQAMPLRPQPTRDALAHELGQLQIAGDRAVSEAGGIRTCHLGCSKGMVYSTFKPI